MQQFLAAGATFRHGQNFWTNVDSEGVRPALLLWLNEQREIADRKERRAFAIEVSVAVLVAAELIVGIGSLWYAVYEARQQNVQLVAQVKHQDEQFNTQQAILNTQLGILQNLLKASQESSGVLTSDQAQRLAEAQAEPNVKLTYGDKRLPKFIRGSPRDGGRTVDFVLRNTGTAEATGIRIIVSGTGITDIICNDESFKLVGMPVREEEQVSIRKKITIPDALAKKVGKIMLSLTFKGNLEMSYTGSVHFEVMTDQHPAALDLGSTTIRLFL